LLQYGADRFDECGGYSLDDGVSAPYIIAVKRRQQNAADIVGGVLGCNECPVTPRSPIGSAPRDVCESLPPRDNPCCASLSRRLRPFPA